MCFMTKLCCKTNIFVVVFQLNIGFLSECMYFILLIQKCCLSQDNKDNIWCLLRVERNIVYSTFAFGDFWTGTPRTMGTQQTTSLQPDHSLFGGFYVIRVAILIYKPCSVVLALITCLPHYADS